MFFIFFFAHFSKNILLHFACDFLGRALDLVLQAVRTEIVRHIVVSSVEEGAVLALAPTKASDMPEFFRSVDR